MDVWLEQQDGGVTCRKNGMQEENRFDVEVSKSGTLRLCLAHLGKDRTNATVEIVRIEVLRIGLLATIKSSLELCPWKEVMGPETTDN